MPGKKKKFVKASSWKRKERAIKTKWETEERDNGKIRAVKLNKRVIFDDTFIIIF